MTTAYDLRERMEAIGISPTVVVGGRLLWASVESFNRSCSRRARLSKNKRKLVADRLRLLGARASALAAELDGHEADGLPNKLHALAAELEQNENAP